MEIQNGRIKIDIASIGNASELALDDSNQGHEEFERQRILKGVLQRLKESRPSMFDLFYVNTGQISDQFLPTICASYVLLDPEAVFKYTGLKIKKPLTEEEINQLKDDCHFFESVDKYWEYLIVILEDKIEKEPDVDLLAPFNSDIVKFVDETSVDELEQYIFRIQHQLIKCDLEEHADFYRQLVRRLRFILATSWHDRFHNDLLKKIANDLPARSLVQVSNTTGDIELDDSINTFYTKTQKKYRIKVLQQENGVQMYNAILKLLVEQMNRIRSENVRMRPLMTSQIEGLQYWGDIEEEFNDVIPLHYNDTDDMILPAYQAIVYKGHDWNEYNRVKYDPNHRPPLTIRGYLWHIHFPNLKNKANAPKFRIDKNLLANTTEPVPDNAYKYTAIVFEAGPPYLPIAFRIVDKAFDEYRRNGYISEFHHGVFTFQITFRASLYYKDQQTNQLY